MAWYFHDYFPGGVTRAPWKNFWPLAPLERSYKRNPPLGDNGQTLVAAGWRIVQGEPADWPDNDRKLDKMPSLLLSHWHLVRPIAEASWSPVIWYDGVKWWSNKTAWVLQTVSTGISVLSYGTMQCSQCDCFLATLVQKWLRGRQSYISVPEALRQLLLSVFFNRQEMSKHWHVLFIVAQDKNLKGRHNFPINR